MIETISYEELPDAGDLGLEEALLDLCDIDSPEATRRQLQIVKISEVSFDSDFLDDDWQFLDSTELRAICIYRASGSYGLLDGRHRLVLAEQSGEETIEAYVLLD